MKPEKKKVDRVALAAKAREARRDKRLREGKSWVVRKVGNPGPPVGHPGWGGRPKLKKGEKGKPCSPDLYSGERTKVRVCEHVYWYLDYVREELECSVCGLRLTSVQLVTSRVGVGGVGWKRLVGDRAREFENACRRRVKRMQDKSPWHVERIKDEDVVD
jgi:hypothetical protein